VPKVNRWCGRFRVDATSGLPSEEAQASNRDRVQKQHKLQHTQAHLPTVTYILSQRTRSGWEEVLARYWLSNKARGRGSRKLSGKNRRLIFRWYTICNIFKRRDVLPRSLNDDRNDEENERLYADLLSTYP
jgi:hypothetical protein